jgi:hypothetical protein
MAQQSREDLNEFTLSIMSNRTKYDKYKKSIESTSLEEAANETFRNEKMYYKERILHMTRDLFHERCENDDINRAHHEYLKSCIDYLKWSDITDMIEADTRSEVRDANDGEDGRDVSDINGKRTELHDKIQASAIIHDADDADDAEPCEDVEEDSPSPSPSPSPSFIRTQTSSMLSIANKMCIRKKTIDDFIVLKPAMNNNNNNASKLPKIRDYHNEIMKRAAATSEIVRE